MPTTLTIIRYRNIAIPFGFLSMAFFKFPLWINKKYSFHKLMGCGKNGSFDKHPDLNQWAVLLVHKHLVSEHDNRVLLGKFISTWIRLFAQESFTILLEPVVGHGLWDKKQPFGKLESKHHFQGMVGTLTRATIRLNKLKYFWRNVAPVANQISGAQGFVFSVGIGEIPWIKQATFSVWESVEDMKAFAYGMKEHGEVIKKTRAQNWYSEDLFVRFEIKGSFGTIRGINPLKIKP